MKTSTTGIGDGWLRLIIPDSHGMYIDKQAEAACLAAAKLIRPNEVVCLGDHVDVSGMYSAHPPNYVKDLEYSYEEDLAAADSFLTKLQKNTPGARYWYLEGNHEQHAERFWARTVHNAKDAKAMCKREAPAKRLRLAERGIKYCRMAEMHDGLSIPGTIKLGKCFFTHGFTAGKFATAIHCIRYGANIVHGHCFSADTELLSPTGWVSLDNVESGTLVATMHPHTKKMEFQSVQQKFVYDDYKEIHRFSSNAMDHLVTADHGMVYTADAKFPHLTHRAAKDMNTNSYFYVSGIEDRMSNTAWTEDEIRLWVQCITDGSHEATGLWRWHLKKQRKIDRLSALLGRLGIPFTLSNLSTAGSRKLYIGRLPEKFTKALTREACTFSEKQATSLLDEWSYTDGTRYKGAAQLCTSIRSHADILQELSVRSGHKCNLSSRANHTGNMYALSIRWFITTVFCKKGYNKGPEPYTGKVWCVSVANGTLFARRNGKVLVTANTHRVQEYGTRTIASDAIGGWCPGTLAQLQPLYRHTSPTEWRHGFGLQMVAKDGRFIHINVPIVKGWCGLEMLIKTIRPQKFRGGK